MNGMQRTNLVYKFNGRIFKKFWHEFKEIWDHILNLNTGSNVFFRLNRGRGEHRLHVPYIFVLIVIHKSFQNEESNCPFFREIGRIDSDIQLLQINVTRILYVNMFFFYIKIREWHISSTKLYAYYIQACFG